MDTVTQTIATQLRCEQAADKNTICTFRVNVPEAELTELRRRINATKWPEKETVADASQGVQLATMQRLARYWATEYDWRKCEARLNAHRWDCRPEGWPPVPPVESYPGIPPAPAGPPVPPAGCATPGSVG